MQCYFGGRKSILYRSAHMCMHTCAKQWNKKTGEEAFKMRVLVPVGHTFVFFLETL